MLEGVLIDEAVEGLCEFTRHFGWATRAWAIPQALGPLLGKALHPCAEGGIGQMESRGDSVNMVPCPD
jgi:hypothetical protein